MPFTLRVPFTTIAELAKANLTTTPGSIVRDEPAATPTVLVAGVLNMIYGIKSFVHMRAALEEIKPFMIMPLKSLLIPSVGLSWNCESCTVTAPPIFNNPIFVELSISEFVIFAVPSLSTIKLTPWFLVRRELERLRIPWTRRLAGGDKDWKCPPKRTRAWERVADPKGPTKICCQSPACGELVEPSLLVSPPTVSSLREVKITG